MSDGAACAILTTPEIAQKLWDDLHIISEFELDVEGTFPKPDQKIIKTDIENMVDAARREKITRTALILVGSVLENQDFEDSALYDPTKPHLLRNKKT